MPEEPRNFEEEQATDAMPGSSHPLEPPPSGSGSDGPRPKRLYRSSDKKMLLGVCGGLGEYFDIDPTIVRVVFALLTIVMFSGVLIYVVLAIIMPSEENLEVHPREAARSTVDEAVHDVTDAANQAAGWVRSKVGKSQGPPGY